MSIALAMVAVCALHAEPLSLAAIIAFVALIIVSIASWSSDNSILSVSFELTLPVSFSFSVNSTIYLGFDMFL